MMTQREARALVGRRIVKVELRRFPTDRAGAKRNDSDYWATDPQILLDNGRWLRFNVQETEVGEYGVELVLSDPPRKQS
jgi:hypothetical protein